jgi:hypothetical protein
MGGLVLKRVIWSVVVMFVLLVFLSLINKRDNSDAVAACVTRGEAYFREVGSYPTLSDGRDAVNLARERCERTLTAF